MGQYYRIVNVDKKEYIHPDGVKLMEHSWVGNESIEELHQLLRGRWSGDRVVDAGDYFEADENKSVGIEYSKQLYSVGEDGEFTDITTSQEGSSKEWTANQQKGFYLNLDKKQYVNLSTLTLGGIEDWKISPLTLMIACGNDRGGGDFHEGSKGFSFVGTWAGDHVAIEDTVPEGFTEIKPDFQEKR